MIGPVSFPYLQDAPKPDAGGKNSAPKPPPDSKPIFTVKLGTLLHEKGDLVYSEDGIAGVALTHKEREHAMEENVGRSSKIPLLLQGGAGDASWAANGTQMYQFATLILRKGRLLPLKTVDWEGRLGHVAQVADARVAAAPILTRGKKWEEWAMTNHTPLGDFNTDTSGQARRDPATNVPLADTRTTLRATDLWDRVGKDNNPNGNAFTLGPVKINNISESAGAGNWGWSMWGSINTGGDGSTPGVLRHQTIGWAGVWNAVLVVNYRARFASVLMQGKFLTDNALQHRHQQWDQISGVVARSFFCGVENLPDQPAVGLGTDVTSKAGDRGYCIRCVRDGQLNPFEEKQCVRGRYKDWSVKDRLCYNPACFDSFYEEADSTSRKFLLVKEDTASKEKDEVEVFYGQNGLAIPAKKVYDDVQLYEH